MLKGFKNKIITTILFLFILFLPVISFSGQLVDEFSSIYHSHVIIETAVSLDETGHPEKSCYLRTIKGKKSDVDEILDAFDICKGGLKVEQKRVMMFYRNENGELRSMNMIKEGVGPFSGDNTYKSYLGMISLLNRKLKKYYGNNNYNQIVLSDRSFCKTLLKNDYFNSRYVGKIADGKFSVGAKKGAFKEFSPLVKVDCTD